VPASSTDFPRKSSPRKGLRGFFSLPNFSDRLAYCNFNVARNHFRTSRARFWGSFSAAGATKIEGCFAQYEENSVRLVDERMNGGAVRDERSPEKVAMDFRKAVQVPLFWAARASPSPFSELAVDILDGLLLMRAECED